MIDLSKKISGYLHIYYKLSESNYGIMYLSNKSLQDCWLCQFISLSTRGQISACKTINLGQRFKCICGF